MSQATAGGLDARGGGHADAGRLGGRYWIVVLELALVLAAIGTFRIEEAHGFVKITPLIFLGFLVHAALPLRFRLPFFFFLSAGSALYLFGVGDGLRLVVIGLSLIGICHLPVRFGARVALLVAAGAALAALRAEWVPAAWSTLVLPIVGSMFMFRLVIYLYDLRHDKVPASIWQRLSYFFLLPNLCFPLFPVVDYQSFRRTYYDDEAHRIYHKGLLWMLRGVFHLLLYRIVYYHLVPSPEEVRDLGGVVVFVVSSYLLYLRVSGQFHLIVGILCLFGFNLPATHHLYYLASSFNDIWRRLNIYWKDFMVKVFYYPVLMRLRSRGMTAARIGATAAVFAATWLLHSYQWFWLRGDFPLAMTDALFWSVLGVLVLVNSLVEARRGAVPAEGSRAGLGGAVARSLRILGIFAFMSVLWSFWSSPSSGEWLSVVAQARHASAAQIGGLAAGIVALVGAGVLAQTATRGAWARLAGWGRSAFPREALVTASAAGALLLAGTPAVGELLGDRTSGLLASLREDTYNRRDMEILARGYYDGLLDEKRYVSKLWDAQLWTPIDWKQISRSPAARKRTDGLLQVELVPSKETVFKRAWMRTNRWGMRDKEYEREKPPGTYRVALLGASYGMGDGVRNDETYEWVAEDRLNRELAGGTFAAYEILNFSVSGYSLIDQVEVCRAKVFSFEPDAVVCTSHSGYMRRALRKVGRLVRNGIPLPPELQDVVERAGLERGMGRAEMERRLPNDPFGDEVVAWGFREIVELCRERGAVPVWLFIPGTQVDWVKTEEPRLARLARESGFLAATLSGAFEGHDKPSIQVAPWDTHPTPLGHRLLADRLYDVLLGEDQLLGLHRSGSVEQAQLSEARAAALGSPQAAHREEAQP